MKTPAFFLRAAAVAVLATTAAYAQVTVFNDTFGAGSTINSNPTSPAQPSVDATAYQQVAAKVFNPNPPTIAAGHLRHGIVSTTSGFNHIQALFTKYPVTLANNSDYIELTVTFWAEGGLFNAVNSNSLFFGLHNAGQVQPVPGGLNNTGTNALAGYAASWTGYVNRIVYGSSSGFYTRPAQGAAASNNQDVLYNYSSAATVTSATIVVPALTPSTPYTYVYRITKTGTTSLGFTANLYSGASAIGTPIYTQSGTSSTTLTATYDALGIGYRSNASLASVMDIQSIKVTTNAATTIVPVINTQPFTQTKTVGETLTLNVDATGGGSAPITYQWYKGADAISGATSASYTINSVATTDAGAYSVVVTGTAGTVTSNVATISVTLTPIPPSFLTQPVGATLLVGANTTFSALASGSGTVTYQWQFSADGGATYTDIAGATTTSYTVTSAQAASAGLYRLVATNSLGSANSDPATLVVTQIPAFTTQPSSAVLNPGDTLTLTAAASGAPLPAYQWFLNGTAISGATSATYTVASVTGANAGTYTVTATNFVGSATSTSAGVAVLSPSLAVTARTPVNAATSIIPDTRLTLTFNAPVTAGITGTIKVYDASTNGVVDTIDLAAATALKNSLRTSAPLSVLNLPLQNKTVGTLTNFNYYPLTFSGNTATIYLRNGVLANNKSYYVTVDAGAFVDASNQAFSGLTGTTAWTFSTRTSGPTTGATLITVAADGSGDFHTVQAALDFVPASNSTPTTIFIKTGTYYEIVYFTGKNNLTIRGESRAGTIIDYPNNNNLNNLSGTYHRMTFFGNSVTGTVLTNLTVRNSTPQGGSQAEAVIINGNASTGKNIITAVDLYSYQDTLQLNGQAYVSDCYIEGDVDFLWGTGPAFFKNCTLKMMRSVGGYFNQIRNSQTNHGFVFVDCVLTAIPGASGHYLNRIDPNNGLYPYSEVVWINCTMGDFIIPAGWKLDNATTAPNAFFAEYNTINAATGLPLDVSQRAAFSKQLTLANDATTITNYSTPSYVLGGSWTPALAPFITKQPLATTATVGQPLTLTAAAAGIPTATYQWYKGTDPIPGATSATYTVASATANDAGNYSVTVTNTNGTATSTAAAVTVRSAFEAYAAGYGLTSGGNGAPTADPDGDGLANQVEFILGGNPLLPDNARLPAASWTTDAPYTFLVITYDRVATAAAAASAVTVEYSSNLTAWTTAVAGVNLVTIDITSLGGGMERVTTRVPVPFSGVEPRIFARLKVTL